MVCSAVKFWLNDDIAKQETAGTADHNPVCRKENLMLIESFKDAVKWRRIHRNKLKLGKRLQRRLARNLKKCRHNHRCGTEACRVCMREFRISWLGEAIKIMVQRPHWTRGSIISKGLLVARFNQFERI
jgi:hypothetical protein